MMLKFDVNQIVDEPIYENCNDLNLSSSTISCDSNQNDHNYGKLKSRKKRLKEKKDILKSELQDINKKVGDSMNKKINDSSKYIKSITNDLKKGLIKDIDRSNSEKTPFDYDLSLLLDSLNTILDQVNNIIEEDDFEYSEFYDEINKIKDSCKKCIKLCKSLKEIYDILVYSINIDIRKWKDINVTLIENIDKAIVKFCENTIKLRKHFSDNLQNNCDDFTNTVIGNINSKVNQIN